MDLQQVIFPFVMAVLTNSILILLMFFLRKSKYFANTFGIGFLVFLYLMCILRVALPIEFPNIQIILRDRVLYTVILDFFKNRSPVSSFLPFSPLYILLTIWAIASTVLLVRFIVLSISDYKKYKPIRNLANDHEIKIFKDTVQEVFGKEKNIAFLKTELVDGSINTGYFKKKILIPNIEFDEKELKMILLHECIHIKNKDIWIKLLVRIYCIIFCWNPFAYLLQVDLSNTLETKCDLMVIRTFHNKVDKALYAKTLAKFMDKENRSKKSGIYSAFSKTRSNQEAKSRMMAILSNPPKKGKQIALNIIVGVAFIAIFAASYLFIWQPKYNYQHFDEKEYELADNGKISDSSNAYLTRQDDGNYIFHYENETDFVTREDIEQGLYGDYPILEK